ncbi:ACR3 family arsenite efflux transporter [Hyphobacterium sp. CCMP332]|uniref:ACR3 family arsenite efflux transporter n=1 Tax=Hyphobacterium sp. CCMP332 TaxID=2749086 RepID=UPI001F3310C9|nr:ACR3 family arsenite efflux transporter [Hyphobacterium sp. CCMP332]
MTSGHKPVPAPDTPDTQMGLFEGWLSVWVALAIGLGLLLGNLVPGAFAFLSTLEIFSVNLAVGVLIWVMIYPMMVNIDPASLARIGDRPKGLLITIIVNWAIKPFTMAALGIVFFRYVFAPFMESADAEQYIAGLIILGAAPCTAMVFVWSRLTGGDAEYTLLQVTVNDLIMIIAFAPIVGFLLGVTGLTVPWETLLLSAGLFVAAPLAAGIATRSALLRGNRAQGEARLDAFSARIKPLSAGGLLLTVVLLFGFQGNVILEQPLLIAMIAVPLLIQTYGIFFLAYGAAWALKSPHAIAAPCALIGTSNFFELAVAVAIGLYGLNSGAALATVVGVLVEVPVMLSLVAIANRTRSGFAQR